MIFGAYLIYWAVQHETHTVITRTYSFTDTDKMQSNERKETK